MVAIAAVVLLVVHIIPKGYWRRGARGACSAPWPYLRPAGWLCSSTTMPREQWLRDFYAWRFEHAPQAIDRMWRRIFTHWISYAVCWDVRRRALVAATA